VIIGLIVGLFFGLFFGLTFGLGGNMHYGLLHGLFFGLISGGFTEVEKIRTEELIWSQKRFWEFQAIFQMVGLFFGIIFGGSLLRSTFGPTLGLIVGVTIGVIGSLIFGLIVELYPVIQHYTLRFWLACSGIFPWKAAAFLEDSVARILLRRVGSGYSFTHRTLMDYFADLSTTTPSTSTGTHPTQQPPLP
jgi:hypothetical protein